MNIDTFMDELQKISAVEPENLSTPQKVVGGIGAAMGANLVGANLAAPIQRELLSRVKPSDVPIDPSTMKALKSGLSDVQTLDAPNWRGSFMIPKGGTLPKSMRKVEEAMYQASGLPKETIRKAITEGAAVAPLKRSPEFLAHELGHASLRDPRKTNILLRGLIRGRTLGPTLGVFGGGALAMQDKDSTALKLAPAAAAAGFVPLLADEALSSTRAMKAIRSAKQHSPAALKVMRRNLAKAFGTYGAMAAGVTAPIGLISYLRSRKD